jgi:hypothetical protein
MSVTSQEDDGVMGGDERKRKIRSKSLSGPKLEGGNLEKGQLFHNALLLRRSDVRESDPSP